MSTYNLLDEKWIDCVDMEGLYQSVSLVNLFRSAHNIRSLTPIYPIINSALLFLLEAILLRVYTNNGFELNDPETWINIFEAGHFNDGLISEYFDTWQDRFNLFDEDYPFYQAIIEEEKVDQFTGTAMKLMPHFTGGTGGNTLTLFDHNTMEAGIAFSPKEAAQFLLAAHTYGAGGRLIGSDYFSDSFISGGLSFFVKGQNLFETLVLNLLPYGDIVDVPADEKDCPIWEQTSPYDDQGRSLIKDGKHSYYRPYGLMDMLTWPGRKIYLIRDEDGLVRNIRMRAGLKIKQDYFPWFAYKRSGKIVRAAEGKTIWRDYDVLLQIHKMMDPEDLNRPLQSIDWINEIMKEGYLTDQFLTISATGMAKEPGKQKVHFYLSARLPLPSVLLESNDLLFDIGHCLETAEQLRGALYGATAVLAERLLSFDSDKKDGRKPDRADRDEVIRHFNAEAVYWASLEPAFTRLVTHLPQDRGNSLVVWQQDVRAATREALEYALRLAGTSAAALKASVHARAIVEKSIREKLPLLIKEITNE